MHRYLLVLGLLAVGCAPGPRCDEFRGALCEGQQDSRDFVEYDENGEEASVTIPVCTGNWAVRCAPGGPVQLSGVIGCGMGELACPEGSSPACVTVPCDGVEHSD